ncbi:hypothetical protein VTK73DRAFT_1603 [Phialemonium thermophilum]|uniref:DUF1531-domain-containing protein n=1 Tax=Phialemonium thermophilum TaxID=223376 RepID=A0ABR3Y327_9PEZI
MDPIINLVSTAGSRFTTNLKGTFANMTPEKWIRLVIIVGAYLLVRPYLLKLGAKIQMQAHDREEKEAAAAVAAKAQMSPNQLRGRVEIPEDSDEEEEQDGISTTAADWGKKARRRQREVIRRMLDAEERRLREQQEDEEDKDIEEFLVRG